MTNYVGRSNFVVSSVGWNAVTPWAPSTVYTAGQVRRQSGVGHPTMTIATPAVFTWNDRAGTLLLHGLAAGDQVVFTNNGDTLPAPLAFNTTYFVISAGLTTSAFELSATYNGTAINTTGGSQAGTHVATALHQSNERCFVCIVGGTSGTVEPTAFQNTVITRGALTTDNTVTWQECTGLAGLNGLAATDLPTWAVGTVGGFCIIGHLITDNAGTHLFMCKTNNTAVGGAEPSWVTTSIGSTTTDGSTTWTYLGLVASAFPALSAPAANIFQPRQANYQGVGTQKIYVMDNHNYNAYSFQNMNTTVLGAVSHPIDVISVDHTATPPFTSANRLAGATETYSGNANFTSGLDGWARWYGFNYILGALAGGGIAIGQAGTEGSKIEKCTMQFLNSGSLTLTGGRGDIKNCQVKFANAASTIGGSTNTGQIVWHNDDGSSILMAGSTVPTVLCGMSFVTGSMKFKGVDLSGCTGASGLVTAFNSLSICTFVFENCKIPATLALTSNFNEPGLHRIEFINCDAGAFFNHCAIWQDEGSLDTDRVIYRQGGSVILASAFSWNINLPATQQTNNTVSGMRTLPMSAYNTSTALVTATIYGFANTALQPTNQDVYVAIDYQNSATDCRTTRITSECLMLDTPAALTSDGSSWTGSVAARANTHAYTVGQQISLASNTGRVFFCTTAGTSAGSEPGGYATAVDGGSVTDGGAVFRAAWRFKIVQTFTPPIEGNVVSNAYMGLAGGAYWIDPTLYLT